MYQISRIATRCAMTVFAIAVFILASLLPLPLSAQNTYGSIVGIVSDSSGALVTDASVTVTNIGTGQTVKSQTDSGGKYSVQDLLPADYKVEVNKASFKRVLRDHVTVQVGAVVRIDFTLAVGDTNEVVEVSTAVPLLQTDSSNLAQEVEGDVVQQMPLNGRNVMNLVELAPGVVPTGGASGGAGLDQSAGRTAGGVGWNNYEIGGAIQGWSATYIDGVPNQLYGDNVIALIPTQEAIQEFSVVSSNATADYGRFAGGVITMATKSGSNAFHGSAYEYLRNRDFNANTWFSNHNNIPRAQWNQNQYGATLNGPIKKDRAFFLFTWENFKALTATNNAFQLPTQAMQNGTLNHPFVDPRGNCNVVNNGNGTYSITNLYGAAAPGGLDATCGDPLNKVLKQLWPLPNTNVSSGNNWFNSSSLGNSQTQYNGRVDYQISPKQRFFARYTYWTLADNHNLLFGNVGSPAFGSSTPTNWPTATNATSMNTHQGVVGDTYTLNASTVLDVRASVTRQYFDSAPYNAAVNESQFGSSYGTLASQMVAKTLPEVTVSGGDNLYAFGSVANFNQDWYNTYSLNASLVKILGPHSFKFGVEARLMDNSGTPFAGGASGYYTYANTFSTAPTSSTPANGTNGANCTAGTPCAGDEWASFLMGYPSGNKAAYFQTFQYTAGYSYYQGYYAMDDWQVNKKLTLNLGIRYENPGVPEERNNKLAVLLPNALDPATGITGTEGLVNGSLYHQRGAIIAHDNLFAPRVGFAYRATSNTVIRGGYGLSYIPDDLSGPNGFGTLPFLSAFNAALTSMPQPSSPTPLQSFLSSTATSGLIQPNPKPAATFMKDLKIATNTSTYNGQLISAPVPFQSYPYVQQWNGALSHQFKGDLMAGVSYSGLKGSNLPQIGYPPGTYFSIDELHSQYYSMGYAALNTQLTSLPSGTATCQNAPGLATAPAAKVTEGQCLRPNPYYSDMEDTAHYAARQNYASLQVTAEKRLGSNGRISSNYSWARSMANTDSANQQLENTSAPRTGKGIAGLQDYNNVGNEYSLISYDVTNRFVLDYELNLPFGKGQKFGNSLSGVANSLASGWAINGITILQSGFPVFIQAATPNFLQSSMGAGILRPNAVAGCKKNIGGSPTARVLAGGWFNTSCFVTATSSNVSAGDSTGSQVAFGNEPRVDPTLRSDGVKNFDFAFQKTTSLGFESSSFQFRAEFFNIFNRAQFNPPVNNQGAGNFGAILTQANNPRQIQISGRVNF